MRSQDGIDRLHQSEDYCQNERQEVGHRLHGEEVERREQLHPGCSQEQEHRGDGYFIDHGQEESFEHFDRYARARGDARAHEHTSSFRAGGDAGEPEHPGPC